MIVKFNPTGTHIRRGLLKVRLDLYPDVGDKTYSIHHIQVPVIPPEGYQGKIGKEGQPVSQTDFDNWLNSLPKVWQLNPALCHFVIVYKDISAIELGNLAKVVFDKSTVTKLDDALSESDTPAVSALMRTKKGEEKAVKGNLDQVKNAINSRLANLEVEV